MDINKEFDYIVSFAEEGYFENEVECKQLRSLWTAFCLHHNLDVDTSTYHAYLSKLYEFAEDTICKSDYWCATYRSFDLFMGEELC